MILFLFLLFQAGAAAQTAPPAPPPQPIPFSHKQHAGTLKLKCKMCHVNADPGEMMGIPAAGVCMQCHSAIKTDSPSIQKLAGFAESKREIPWTRVYQIPGYVDFSHKRHLDSGVATCETCHGKVAERDALFVETNIHMGGCMDCHRQNKASIDCTACHEQKNQ